MTGYRHCDPRFPFLWETSAQPPGRWHDRGEGPVHYLADTPDGAWAEFLRHEGITDAADLSGVRRALWAIDVPARLTRRAAQPDLATEVTTGGLQTYAACQAESRRLRALGCGTMVAPSAALLPGTAGGWMVDRGVVPGPTRDGAVFVLFGRQPGLVGWSAAHQAQPDPRLLARVRPLG